jgi:hypothetical protein
MIGGYGKSATVPDMSDTTVFDSPGAIPPAITRR